MQGSRIMAGHAGEYGFDLLEIRRMGAVFQELALSAGKAVLDVYDKNIEMRHKVDMSPVSDADEISERIILSGLQAHMPEFPVISEEAVSRGSIPRAGDRFILVDPLDGTREFFAHNGEFTVNIALVHRGAPVLGVVHAPASGASWFGGIAAGGHKFAGKTSNSTRQGQAASRPGDIEVRAQVPGRLVALASRSHLDARTQQFVDDLHVTECRRLGSSLKFCLIAQGEADVYPRFAPTMEWDTAAGDAVLRAAGGIVVGNDGKAMVYGKAGYRNGDFIAWGVLPPV